MGLISFLPGQFSNLDPPDLYLSGSWDYKSGGLVGLGLLVEMGSCYCFPWAGFNHNSLDL
jgi:hypothetical protein